MERPIFGGVFLTSILLASTSLMGQSVLGVGNFIHVVASLDKSIEFYRDAIGLEMTGAPGPRAFSANAVVSSLYNAPGAQSRVASFRIPGSDMAVEIVEFQGLNAPPVQARFFDPGAITLTLIVQDLEATKTRLTKLKGLEWISASDNSVVVRDPDGIFVELVQPRKGPAGLSDTTEVRISVTVEDLDAATRFYRAALGFIGASPAPGTQLKGDAKTRRPLRKATLLVPGDRFPVVLTELNYADRKQVHSEIHDPGSGVLRLRVSDFEGVLNALKAQGTTVVSAGGEPVNLGRSRAVILRSINNLFLQVLESAPPAEKSPAAK